MATSSLVRAQGCAGAAQQRTVSAHGSWGCALDCSLDGRSAGPASAWRLRAGCSRRLTASCLSVSSLHRLPALCTRICTTRWALVAGPVLPSGCAGAPGRVQKVRSVCLVCHARPGRPHGGLPRTGPGQSLGQGSNGFDASAAPVPDGMWGNGSNSAHAQHLSPGGSRPGANGARSARLPWLEVCENTRVCWFTYSGSPSAAVQQHALLGHLEKRLVASLRCLPSRLCKL